MEHASNRLERAMLLLAGERREWMRALLAEQQAVEGRLARARWLAGGLRFTAWVVVAECRRNPRYLFEEALMKTVLGTLAAVNVAAAAGLAGLLIFVDDVPLLVLAIALGLLLQGGYTLAYLAGALAQFEPHARQVFLIGHTLALLVGLLGAVSTVAYNINPPNGDNEYGPMTVALLILTLAVIAVWSEALLEKRARTA